MYLGRNMQKNTNLDNFTTSTKMFTHWAETQPDEVYLRQPVGSSWKTYTWAEAYSQVVAMANYLSRYPQRSRIAIFSLNCADWLIADQAILMAGHISVPIYPTANNNTVMQILTHSESSLVFIGKLPETTDIEFISNDIDKMAIFAERENIDYWDNILAKEVEKNDSITAPDFEAKEKDIATIVYTSGTTGHPKGVMLSYRAFYKALDCVSQAVPFERGEKYFSYLPLSHIAERMVVEMNSIFFGGMVSFVESLDTFAQNLKDTKPTIFFGVPRIWVKLMQGVQQKLGGAKLSSMLMRMPILGNILKNKVIKGLGLDKVNRAISAAAAISPQVLLWYKELGIDIIEVYGLSETTGISHANLPDQIRIGTVGKAIPETDFQLTESGEILIRSPNLMDGYYKQPDITDAAIQDGWFRTGDLGKVDSDGFLTITGRAKEIFKTSKGKYISPTPIEAKVQPALEVEQLVVTGVDLPQPIVIAVMLKEEIWADKKNSEKKFVQILSTINESLEKHERLSHLVLVSEEWTIESGMMTPTLKLRRQQIEDKYMPELTSLNRKKPIVWLE